MAVGSIGPIWSIVVRSRWVTPSLHHVSCQHADSGARAASRLTHLYLLSYLEHVRLISQAGRFRPILRAGLLTGLLVAAVTYPLAAVGGLGVKAGSDLYQALPSALKVVPPAQTTYVYAADGTTLLTMFYDEY